MSQCEWAKSLTNYDYHAVLSMDGEECIEIGTPFSLPDGSAINLYVTKTAHGHIKIGDNADTLFQLGGMGLDVWQPMRLNGLRTMVECYKMQIGEQGDAYIIAKPQYAANAFALAITGILSLSSWASSQLGETIPETDIVAELEPYVIARNTTAIFKRHPSIKGASSTLHDFDFQHGNDLIEIIRANPNATGSAMRKAGDVQNGPFAEHLMPLIIVDDRTDSEKAMNEIGILESMTRAMPVTKLMKMIH